MPQRCGERAPAEGHRGYEMNKPSQPYADAALDRARLNFEEGRIDLAYIFYFVYLGFC